MKNNKILLALLALSTALTINMEAQGRGQGRGEGRGQGRGPEGGLGGPQGGPPVFAALDANKDGELSAAEIKNAVAVLKKLDSNGDGKLTVDEIRPRRGEGGPGRGGFGQNEGRRRGPGGPGGREGGAGQLADRLMQADANGDGKVSKDELPERMQRLMGRLDANKDGFITREEAEKASASFGNRGGQERGQGQGQGRGRGQGQRQRPRP
jgi:Ca2+-binding EF-hand superfamily protein